LEYIIMAEQRGSQVHPEFKKRILDLAKKKDN